MIYLRESSKCRSKQFSQINTQTKILETWNLIFIICNFPGKRVNVKICKVGFMLFNCNTWMCFYSFMCSVCWINIIILPLILLMLLCWNGQENVVYRPKGFRKKELKHSNLLSCWYALMYNVKTTIFKIWLKIVGETWCYGWQLATFTTKTNLKFIKCSTNMYETSANK